MPRIRSRLKMRQHGHTKKASMSEASKSPSLEVSKLECNKEFRTVIIQAGSSGLNGPYAAQSQVRA